MILQKLFVFIIVTLFPVAVLAHAGVDKTKRVEIWKQAKGIQVPFIKNAGQIRNKDVGFYAKTFGGTIFIEKSGVLTYKLPAKDKKGVVIKEIFTDKAVKITPLKPLPTRVNYFKGKDKRNWKKNIPCYNRISLGKVFKGINLALRACGDNVEKIFTVLPGQNPEEIRVRVTGARKLKVDETGGLEVVTGLGPVKFTKPSAFQEIGAEKRSIEVAYAVFKGNTYGFAVGRYDKKRPLIIDPLLASTFIGGGNADLGKSIAIDQASGNVYVTGYTGSSDYPATLGSYDDRYDVFVSKLSSDLSTILASTFMGENELDWAVSIAVDGSENVYVAGYTSSKGYPTMPGAYDRIHNGSYDAFISKLNSDLVLTNSTFIGGSDEDLANSIGTDSSGNVYVTGQTKSDDYPTKSGAYGNHSGNYDVFVSKLNSDLSTLLASTFIGGSAEDTCRDIALDGSGNVYVTGKTYSPGYPTTPDAYDEAHTDNNDSDVFISKLNSDLSDLSASTFMGGEFDDNGNSIAVDASGNVYVMGETSSATFPATPCDGYDASHNGLYDVFVSKLHSDLSDIMASTFIGGTKRDYGNSMVIADGGEIYVTGRTESVDFPTTSNADYEDNNGDYDVFVSKLNESLNYLLASTFIGGSEEDQANSIAIDASGDVYVTGETLSADYPTKPGVYNEAHNGNYDVFVSRLDGMTDVPPITLPVARAGSDAVVVDEGTIVTLDGSGSEACNGNGNEITSWEWEQINILRSSVGLLQDGETTTFTAPDINVSQETLTFQLTVTDSTGVTDSSTVNITVNWIVPPPPSTGDGGGGCFIGTVIKRP